MQTLSINSTVILNNGVVMPRLGLGVWKTSPGEETRAAVRAALEVGYRHIDTARAYGNEQDVGEAISASGISRDKIFVTTKLWNDDHGFNSTLSAFDTSLKNLGTDYIDLFLIHWPVPEKRAETWRAFEKIARNGKCRAIGVSNFMPHHLEQLKETSATTPAVNQIEFHPFLYQKDVLSYCHAREIVIEAYSPLTHGQRLDHPVLVEIANQYNKTAAQLLIRWGLQHGLSVLPKSINTRRISENANVFDIHINDADMQKLDELDEDLRTCWDPSDVP
jgi:diketogulonate reductase-like aldo/keto reductase